MQGVVHKGHMCTSIFRLLYIVIFHLPMITRVSMGCLSIGLIGTSEAHHILIEVWTEWL